jgi:shikimate dehydrogenase
MLAHYSGATRVYFVVGDPIAQVSSPFGMTEAFEQRGIDAICVPIQVAPADFQAFMATVRALKNCDGVVITIPHKFAALPQCNSVSDRAGFLGAVNCIRRARDGSLDGDMLDGLGFVRACRQKGCEFAGKRALLVGLGGAGTAIAHAVASAGVRSLTLADLDGGRAERSAAQLRTHGCTVMAGAADASDYDLVFNATPMGMRVDDPLPVPVAALLPGMFVGCVITQPAISPLIRAARGIGCRTSTGADMFIEVRELMLDFLLARAGPPTS